MKFVIVDTNSSFRDLMRVYWGNEEETLDCYDPPKDIAAKIAVMDGLQTGNNHTTEDPLHIFINLEDKINGSKRQTLSGFQILIWLRCKYRICNPVIFYGFHSCTQIMQRKPESLVIYTEGCYYYQLPFDFGRLAGKTFKGLKNWDGFKKYLMPSYKIEDIRHQEANKWGVGKLRLAHQLIRNITPINDQELAPENETMEELLYRFIYNEKDKAEFALSKYQQKYTDHYQPTLQLKKHASMRILVIEDYEPWFKTYEDILGCKILKEKPFRPLDKFIEHIIQFISREQPNVVLLDLRLFDEIFTEENPTNYSGAKVLIEIKKRFLALPVIITTASNKIQNLKKLLQLGCETMWTKEGTDMKLSTESSLMNYLELLDAVLHAINKFPRDIDKTLYTNDVMLIEFQKTILEKRDQLAELCNPAFKDSLIIADETIFGNLQYMPAIYLLIELKEIFPEMDIKLPHDVLNNLSYKANMYIDDQDAKYNESITLRYMLVKYYEWFENLCVLNNITVQKEENNYIDISKPHNKLHYTVNKILKIFNKEEEDYEQDMKKEEYTLSDTQTKILDRIKWLAVTRNGKILLITDDNNFGQLIERYFTTNSEKDFRDFSYISGKQMMNGLKIHQLLHPSDHELAK